MLRPLLRSRRFTIGLLILAGVLAAAIAGAVVAGDPFQPSDTVLGGPSSAHPFGTDQLGRDVLTRILDGSATALLIAIPPAVVAGLLGAVVGLAAGYYGGLLDEILLKLIEFVLIIPRFLLALVVVALFGGSVWIVVVVLAFTFWPQTARLARAEAITLRQQPFVEAATSIGGSDSWIIRQHLWPLALPVIIVNTTFQAGQAVLIETALAFLGLGDRNVVSWGAMLTDAQSYLGVAWWISIVPGLAIGLLVFAMNLLGDGLADAWSTRRHTPTVRAVSAERVGGG